MLCFIHILLNNAFSSYFPNLSTREEKMWQKNKKKRFYGFRHKTERLIMFYAIWK